MALDGWWYREDNGPGDWGPVPCYTGVYSVHALRNVSHTVHRPQDILFILLCPCMAQFRGQTQPTIPPGAIPAGAEEFTAVGAEVTERGGASGAGALLSGGNIRSCFLTFNFLR